MIARSNLHWGSSLKVFISAASGLVSLLGGLVLIGWALDISALKSVFPGSVTMKANTALAFLLAGLALWIFHRGQVEASKRRLAQGCAVIVTSIGLLTLSEYIFGWDLGIDQLLFKEEQGAVGTSSPGRMAPTTALNFLLLGLAILLLDVRTGSGRRPAQYLSLLVGVISILALVGYTYGVSAFYGIASYTQMAIHTAAAFALLSLALLFVHPDQGIMAVLSSSTLGGTMARRLLPATIGILVFFGWLRLQGERAGLYATELGVALFAVQSIVILSILIWWSARSLDRADKERRKAEVALRRAHDELELRVRERTEALRKSESQLSLVYQHVSDVIFYLAVEPDERFRFLSVNPTFSKATGVAESQVVGKLVQEVIPEPSLRTVVLPNYREAIRGKKTVQWEEVSVYPAGTKYGIVAVTPIFDDKGRCTNLVGTVHDITEIKQSEEEIRRLNAELEQRVIERTAQLEAANSRLKMFAALAESSKDFISMATLQGEIFYLNSGGRQLMGLAPDEDPPKSIADYCDPPTWDLIAREGLPAVLQQGLWSGEGKLRNSRTGELWDVQMSTFIIRDPVTGEPLSLGAIDRDITERKRVERALAEQKAQLEAANKELEAFAYSVSHDLRAPLRAIDGFSQALMEEYASKLDVQGKDYLNRVRSGAQRMAQLIDDLLQLSRVTHSEMHRQKLDLTAVAWSIVQDLRRMQPERKVEFVVAAGVVAEGDPRLLRLVLENLLNNAWKFTSQHPTARIEFGVMDGEQGKVYFVRDDGIGFDMAYADKLFGAFQRLHGATEFSGTGIGLATVQRIIHRHGGRVWAEGEVGRGATFYFTLS